MRKRIVAICILISVCGLMACAPKEGGTESELRTETKSVQEKTSDEAELKNTETPKDTSESTESSVLENETTESPVTDTVVEGIENVPEEYKDLFVNGAFDENMVWTTNQEEYQGLIEKLKVFCEKSAYGSLMLATDDKVIFAGGWNCLEIDEKTTVNPFTTYEIASITKQFTAAAILQLVQDGKLQTSDTIDKYFPQYAHGNKITVDNLLHMDSGIPDFLNESTIFFAGRTPEENEEFMKGNTTDEQMLEYFYKTDLLFEPGEKFKYSNTNYYLLALMIEQITGKTYADYIKESIFDVCGMKNSTCTEAGNMTSVPVPGGVEDYMAYVNACRGSGDIHSNVCDILLWNRALMNKKVINETQFAYMTTPRNGYSCGWNIEGENMNHGGVSDAYVSMTGVYRLGEKNLYLIQMSPYLGKAGYTNNVADMVENYLDSRE